MSKQVNDATPANGAAPGAAAATAAAIPAAGIQSGLVRTGGKTLPRILTGIALAALLVFPLLTENKYLLTVTAMFFVFATLGSAWNLIGGYAAQISWCHAAFVAIGAYTSVLMYNRLGITPWLGMLVGMAISAAASVIIGAVSFRLRGPFFSLSTIAFAELVRVFLNWAKDLTKGSSGLVVTYRRDSFASLTFSSPKYFYYILLAFLLLTVVIVWFVERSRLGYYLKAIKADEDAVLSLGINSNTVKLKAFVLSALIASAVGTVYAFFMSYIDPASVGGLDLSTKIGSMAIVGGLGTLIGPILGAAFLVPLSELANILLGTSGSGMLLYGLALIFVFTYRPKGIRSFFVKDRIQTAKAPVRSKMGGV